MPDENNPTPCRNEGKNVGHSTDPATLQPIIDDGSYKEQLVHDIQASYCGEPTPYQIERKNAKELIEAMAVGWMPDAIDPISCRNEINPPHYQRTCGTELEVIDFIKSILTASQFIGYCAGNAMKYRLRAGKKSDDIETDIKKAIWYEEKIKNAK